MNKIPTPANSAMASAKFRCCQPVSRAWAMARYLICVKGKICSLLLAVCMCLVFLTQRFTINQVGHYSKWSPRSLPRTLSSSLYFVRFRDQEVYMYSAAANYHQPQGGTIGVVVTTLDASRGALDCCVVLDGSRLYTTRAEEYFFYHTIDVTLLARIHEFFTPGYYRARQYLCPVPEIGRAPTHATLKSVSSPCSADPADYVPVHTPPLVHGGLAVCAKIAHSGGLDPEKVIEWFEVQRILGVDKVLLFDMGNPENLTRVFRYYQNLGFLDLQPYELPGKPANRTLLEKDKRTHQFHHDESLAVLECRQRMSGYSYVMSHDLDEFIIPRRDIDLKQFFKEKMEYYQDSAGFYFDAEFFIYNWGPTNPEDDLMLTRYRKATKPHWECTKYVYLPTRVLSSTTHAIFPLHPYNTHLTYRGVDFPFVGEPHSTDKRDAYGSRAAVCRPLSLPNIIGQNKHVFEKFRYRIGPEEAVLHHYRRCPDDVWDTCFPETIIDHIMTRYTDLHSKVLAVRSATRIQPSWTAS